MPHDRQFAMSFGSISCLHCSFATMFARIITLFFFSLIASVRAQEVTSTTTASQPVTELTADSSPGPLNPTADTNPGSTRDLRNEVSADPRRFHYGLQITVRGVYDDNINISQTN